MTTPDKNQTPRAPASRFAPGKSAETSATDVTTVPPVLLDWLRLRFEDPSLNVTRYERLSGGAIQQNLALDVSLNEGKQNVAWVLRTDAASSVDVSLSRLEEFAVLSAAHAAGVTVPEPLVACDDEAVMGAPFFLMGRVGGTANPVRLTRDESRDEASRAALVERLGVEMARIHAIALPLARDGVRDVLAAPPEGDLLGVRVLQYRRLLDALGAQRPVLEWVLAWLERQRLSRNTTVLCHNDFRTGNLMVDGDRVTGVLDWEFAAAGDPMEDIGWFCAPCWRFARRDREAGGLGDRETFYDAYEREAGRVVDRDAVPVWEIVATLRWAIIALQQGARFTSGAEPTLELGLTGRMVAELEQDLVDQVLDQSIGSSSASRSTATLAPTVSSAIAADPGSSADYRAIDAPSSDALAAAFAGRPGSSADYRALDAPAGDALLDAARRLLLDEILPVLPDSHRYRALMIANAMGMAAREASVSNADAQAESSARSDGSASSLSRPSLCAMSDAALVSPAVVEPLRRDVHRRLAVSNPKRAESGAR